MYFFGNFKIVTISSEKTWFFDIFWSLDAGPFWDTAPPGTYEGASIVERNLFQFKRPLCKAKSMFLCGWHVNRKVIWYVTKWRNFEILCNMCSCLCTVLAVSVLYFKKKIGIGCVKIRHFVTYQVTFLLTCQPQKYKYLLC